MGEDTKGYCPCCMWFTSHLMITMCVECGAGNNWIPKTQVDREVMERIIKILKNSVKPLEIKDKSDD